MTEQDLIKVTKLSKDIKELEDFLLYLEKTHEWKCHEWKWIDKLPGSSLTLNVTHKDKVKFPQSTIINKLTLREGSDAADEVVALAKQYHTLVIAMANEELKILKKEFQEFTGSVE